MASRVPIHDVNPFLQKCRDFLLGRKHTTCLRFADKLATRSPPPPNLPDGPHHALKNIYYYARDARREVKPPEVVAPIPKLLEGSTEGAPPAVKRATPGKVFLWD